MKTRRCWAYYLTLIVFLVTLGWTTGATRVQADAGAQEGIFPTLRFTHFTTGDGLSHNAVTAMLQDRQGLMWVGTHDGLNRFDGYTFTTYRNVPGDPNSLSDNHIRALIEDNHGGLWIATQGGGLNYFDPDTEVFTRFMPGRGEHLRRDALFSLFEDRAGNLWIGGAPTLGLYSLEASQVISPTPTFLHYRLDVVTPLTSTTPSTAPAGFRGGVQAIVAEASGALWLAADLALIRFDPATGEMSAYTPHPEESRLNTLTLDARGRLWVGGNTGLYRFDPASERFTAYPFEMEVEALYVAGDTLWIGGSDLYALDISTERVTQPAIHRESETAPLDGVVTAIYQDAGGVLWFGTSEGLSLLDPRQRQFSHYRHDPDDANGLSDGHVQAITGDAAGHVWLATPQTLERLDPATGEVRHYDPKQGGAPFPGPGLSAITLGPQGDIWAGAGSTLYRLDVARETFEVYDTLRARAHPGPPPVVSAIVEDTQGDVWIAMALVGLHRFDDPTDSFHSYLAQPTGGEEDPADALRAGPQTLISDRPSALYVSRKGGLWIGYRDGFLSYYDTDTATFTHYIPSGQRSMGWIDDMYADEAGVLWLATRSGLVRFTPQAPAPDAGQAEGTGILHRYTEEDGLPTTYVQSILAEEDADGKTRYLWLGTANGLSRFDLHTETFHNFDTVDGLGENAFNPGAAWQAPDGRMYFGGLHGLTAFYPDQVVLSGYQPPVILTELRLANVVVSVGTDSLLTQPIWDTDHLTLQHDDDLISFEFAALDYAAPRKLRYRYRLEGLEAAWIPVDSGHRFATYTHLPAGEYTFRVQGTNASGLWSEHEASLALTVLPPWWETLWFRGGLALLVVALSGSFVHWRIRDIRRRNAELERLVAVRTAELAAEKGHVEAAHARLRTVLDNLDALVYVADIESHKILFANAQVRETFGEVEGLICWQALQVGQPEPCEFCTNPHLLTAAGRPSGIYRWQYKNARTGCWYTVADSAIEWIDGRMVRLSMAADITDYKEAEQHLLAQQRLVAALDERERIGRELHDDLGQVMGYVNAQVQAAQALLQQARPDQVQATLRQLAEVAQEAHADVRHYILGVRTERRPVPQDFLTALEHYLQQLHRRYGLIVHVNWPESLRESPLASEVETQLLRIIQEALTNVRKHAGVQKARLIFTLHPEEIQVIVSDEGQGFDVAAATGGTSPASHFGLSIMRERAAKVGGQLEVQAQPGAGTKIIVRLPRTLAGDSGEVLHGLRVLLVDDHDLYLQGLRNLLSARGVHVVGLAHDGLAAQQLAQRYLPDLILMDVEMPRCNGLEATRRIKVALPETRIVMLTVAADEETLFTALKSGADGYLLKDLESQQFFDLLCSVMQGENVLSPALAARTLKELAHDNEDAAAAPQDSAPPLTQRQCEVLEWVARGLTNREIAERLFISPDTVKYHVSQILERLHVQSRYELRGYASGAADDQADTA